MRAGNGRGRPKADARQYRDGDHLRRRPDEALGRTPPGPFRLALYANVTAAPVTDPAVERDLLVQQVTGRVRWRESVITMKAAGIDRFVELGGKVVGPMIGRTVEDVTVTSVVTMADIEALARDI